MAGQRLPQVAPAQAAPIAPINYAGSRTDLFSGIVSRNVLCIQESRDVEPGVPARMPDERRQPARDGWLPRGPLRRSGARGRRGILLPRAPAAEAIRVAQGDDRQRSCRLDHVAPLVDLPGTEFVSFQVEPRAGDLPTSGWRGLIDERRDGPRHLSTPFCR